ncbi:MAG: T9SS type A sorting domain-containing protein [candidate division Zixibacteria bacterium]|nr:T9SS type A sorting domain-containing protein [candidate division Zixibacteria bacterium]
MPTPGTGETLENPMFVDPENYDFNLQEGSPAIGTGRYGEDRGACPLEPVDVNEQDSELPLNYASITSYPNPFNSNAMIKYIISEKAQVKIELYNILGQREAILADEMMPAGQHTLSWNASDFKSGVYFARLIYGQQDATAKLILIK